MITQNNKLNSLRIIHIWIVIMKNNDGLMASQQAVDWVVDDGEWIEESA